MQLINKVRIRIEVVCMLWTLFRILSLALTLIPMLYLYKSKETEERKKIKNKNICVVISAVGIILFIATIFMR